MNFDSRIAGEPISGTPLELEGPAGSPRRRWWIVAAVVAIAAAIGIWLWQGREASPIPASGGGVADGQIPAISYVVPGRDRVDQLVTGTGTLAARRDMQIGIAGEGGIVTRVLVEPGQWVSAGQVLATVDRSVQAQTAETLEAQIRVAQADLDLAEAELERARQLVDRGFISKADIDRRTATRDGARARVRAAQAQLAETRARNARLDIRAPARGLVLTRAIEPGQIVGQSSGVLFRLAQNGEIELQAQLSQPDLARIRAGATAEVVPVGSERSFAGTVWQVSPIIDPQTRQGIARISLPYDPALRPGGFASVRIIAGREDAPLLPESAVLSDAKGSYVYVLDAKDRAVRRDVSVGEVSDKGVSIVAGLTGDERVVLSAGAFLNPGQRVKPVEAKRPG